MPKNDLKIIEKKVSIFKIKDDTATFTTKFSKSKLKKVIKKQENSWKTSLT